MQLFSFLPHLHCLSLFVDTNVDISIANKALKTVFETKSGSMSARTIWPLVGKQTKSEISTAPATLARKWEDLKIAAKSFQRVMNEIKAGEAEEQEV